METEKLDLIKLKKSDWHFRLMRWVLGSLADKPYKAKNFCLYFWMLIASIILSPFALIGRGIYEIICLPFRGIALYLDYLDNLFIDQMDIYNVTKLYDCNKNIPKLIKLRNERWDLLNRWFEKNYGEDWKSQSKWEKILADIANQRKKIEAETGIQYEKWRKDLEKSNARQEKIENFFRKLFIPFIFIGNLISSTWNKLCSQRALVLFAKRTTGLIITALICLVLYLFSSLITYMVTAIIANWNGEAILAALIILGYLALSIIVGVGILLLIIWIKETIGGTIAKILYGIFVVPLKYILWYPIAIGLGYWFIYRFLFELIIVGSLTGFWKFLISSTGIFGEYFGRSYTDYCPGIEWDDETKE